MRKKQKVILINKPKPIKKATRRVGKLNKRVELKKILLTEIHVEPQEESQNPIQECAHMKNEWQHKSQ